jgi:C_GCAxxG_C_C family probable redox protein
LHGLQVVYGLEDDNLWQAGTGFGGGIGGMQDVCGVLGGAVVAASIAMTSLGGDLIQSRHRAYKVVKEAYSRFVDEFGPPDCRQLCGFDFSEPDGFNRYQESTAKAEKCSRYLRFVIETMAAMEQERRHRAASKGS